jgi:hypothetical protein
MLLFEGAHAVRPAGVHHFVKAALNRREINSYFPGRGWINTLTHEWHIINILEI